MYVCNYVCMYGRISNSSMKFQYRSDTNRATYICFAKLYGFIDILQMYLRGIRRIILF